MDAGHTSRWTRRRAGRACAAGLAAAALLLAGAVLNDAVGPLLGPRPAGAGETPRFGDAARQRERTTELLEETNAKLDELIGLLRSGRARVRIETDGAGGEKPARSGGTPDAKGSNGE